MLSLDGKIAIVTGGTRGLGLEIARKIARNGVTVIINSRNKSRLKEACKLIDLSKSEVVKGKNENIMKRCDRLEEVEKSIVCLIRDNFSFSTGNTIIIDGDKIII